MSTNEHNPDNHVVRDILGQPVKATPKLVTPAELKEELRRMAITPPTDTTGSGREGEPYKNDPMKRADYWKERYEILHGELEALRRDGEISEVPCCKCKGPVVEFTVPSEVWNTVIRRGGPETDQEYLCKDCYIEAVSDYVRSAAIDSAQRQEGRK